MAMQNKDVLNGVMIEGRVRYRRQWKV